MPAAYRCRFRDFDASNASHTIGELILSVSKNGFESIYLKAIDAWEKQLQVIAKTIAVLRHELPESTDWQLLLEYEIPRRDRRPDAVILAHDIVFVLEFKVGQDRFLSADDWQAYSYALDLRDFHQESRGRDLIPVLVATAAPESSCANSESPVAHANSHTLANRILEAFGAHHKVTSHPIDPEAWENSPYRPTPTIIEAAEKLFQGHTVSDISHAFASNLSATTDAIVRAITDSQQKGQRTICFVTGIPGAGKTLAGLSAAHNPQMRSGGRPSAMFLSGNGPLVKIVREALTRDTVHRGASRKEAFRTVSTFIGNVHSFLVHHLKDERLPPHEHAIIFDEAQRAWNAEAVEKKRGTESSEPTLILEVMERAPEWCTVIALVGGGQEIYRGEAGLGEWGVALNARETPWQVLVSPELLSGGRANQQLFTGVPRTHLEVIPEHALHLDVSVRSPRAKLIGDWVNELLENSDGQKVAEPGSEFPIALTRDLSAAKRWVRERSDSKERCGLIASSGALRLRAYGIEVSSGFRKGYQYTDWFLSGPDDIRSSSRLEVAATEFECQGLELDWTCLCWGGDFLFDRSSDRWLHRKLLGTKCKTVRDRAEQRYMTNKYRVLLTRARKGMVIWIPDGAAGDPTLEPHLLDSTAEYLLNSGIPALDE